MSEKEKLIENLVEKSNKSKEEIESLISNKVNELSGLVSDEGAIYIVANELGVRLEVEKPKREIDLKKIDKITEAKVPVSLLCKVLKKYDKVTFTSKSGEGSVQSILVGDETGIMRVVFWYDKTEVLDNIQEGDILKIINAYTRENNQNPERIEVHYGQYSDIEVNPENEKVEVKEFSGSANFDFSDKKISEIEDGDKNIKLTAIITDFDIPRFYLGCPNCFKKVSQDEGNYTCAEHEEVEAMKVPIVNLVVDDGSGTIAVVGFRDRAEKLTNLVTKDIISLTEDVNKYKNFTKKIIGANIEIGGNVSLNSMSGDIQVLANQILKIELKNIDEVAKDLASEKKVSTSKKEEKSKDISEDLDDIEIEEIDIDDDLL